MRAHYSIAAFVLFAAALAAGQEKEAKPEKYESKDGKYRVEFPGKPAKPDKKSAAGDLNITMVEKGAGSFNVIYSDLPEDAIKLVKPKDLLDGGQKGLADNFQAKVISSRDFEFGKQKYPSREIAAEKDMLHLRTQLILAENRLYQVFVIGPKELVAGKEADAFLKSFEIAK
jgi:hypothetical protein